MLGTFADGAPINEDAAPVLEHRRESLQCRAPVADEPPLSVLGCLESALRDASLHALPSELRKLLVQRGTNDLGLDHEAAVLATSPEQESNGDSYNNQRADQIAHTKKAPPR